MLCSVSACEDKEVYGGKGGGGGGRGEVAGEGGRWWGTRSRGLAREKHIMLALL